MKSQSFSLELVGKTLTAEFTDLSEQANGSVLLKYGETAILVTAVMGNREKAGMNYFPLSVEFEEKFYAAGAILGSRFMRREGRPSDEAILSARIVDRTIRPLFNQLMRHDVQIVISVLAIGEDDPDVLGVIGASLALSVSDIPWKGPVGAVRIGRKKETQEITINPTYTERTRGLLDFEVLACGKNRTINMIETAANEVAEDDLAAVFEASVEIHQQLENWQADIIAVIGKEKQAETVREIPEELFELFEKSFKTKLTETIFSNRAGKSHIYELKTVFLETVKENELNENVASDFFEDAIDKELHRGAIEEGKRADGRTMDDVRELYAKAGGISPAIHGSGIFYRGGTHIFSALTLGGPEAAQIIDTIESKNLKKRFLHHYNFPPFSVGETGRVGGFNRRMIGHGALAEKALLPVIPSQADFPYTIRLVSETLSSNGSSSMGSVCGSILALMDGGVPITRPVAGIASGVMIDGDRYTLLTDIQGPEDEFGDMDFKVAGTTEGVTAIQMDVKVDGVPTHILVEALEKARLARLQIISVLTNELAVPRENISPRAPKIVTLQILPEQIGLVIGGGGKTINSIKDDTQVEEITIEEDGLVFITGKNGTAEIAAERIRGLTKVYKVGEPLEVTITRLVPFGAFAKLDAFNEGLIHISEIAPFRIETIEGVLKEGETVSVLVSKVDNGKIGLSIKQAEPNFAEKRGLTPQNKVENSPK
ncbi:MAG: polyribonucleotide nucleotidyltransferase [Candidatus Paceibacteria bacterium]|jgi:polyribonucleotide nucleotidyltransferase